MKRDPTKDPRPGDVLTNACETYEILRCDGKTVVDVCTKGWDEGAGELHNPLLQWRSFMQGSKVIRRAEEER